MISATGRPLLAVSMAVGIAGGAVAAFPIGGPLLFAGFKAPLLNGGLSAVIGAAAGLAGADDAGRRYLIGVAAAAQSGVFPVWAGLALLLGFPTAAVTAERCATFAEQRELAVGRYPMPAHRAKRRFTLMGRSRTRLPVAWSTASATRREGRSGHEDRFCKNDHSRAAGCGSPFSGGTATSPALSAATRSTHRRICPSASGPRTGQGALAIESRHAHSG